MTLIASRTPRAVSLSVESSLRCGAHRVSLAQLTIDPVDTVAFVSMAAAAGFNAVGLRLRPAPGANATSTVLSTGDVRTLKRRLQETGVSASLATGLWILPDTDPGHFASTLDLAAEIGVERMLTVCNDNDKSRALEHFSSTCQMAAERDLSIGLEFMVYTALKSIERAAAFLEAAAQPNAGLIVDALHLARSGGTAADVAAIAPALISIVQLCDAPRTPPPADGLRHEARHARLFPGHGELFLHELMDVLPPDIWIDIEAPGDDSASADQKAIRAAQATHAFLSSREGKPLSAA